MCKIMYNTLKNRRTHIFMYYITKPTTAKSLILFLHYLYDLRIKLNLKQHAKK